MSTDVDTQPLITRRLPEPEEVEADESLFFWLVLVELLPELDCFLEDAAEALISLRDLNALTRAISRRIRESVPIDILLIASPISS